MNVEQEESPHCWDCPCHGSQFSTDGEPLQGPANKPLAHVQNR